MSSETTAQDEQQVERILQHEATQLSRQNEVERVLSQGLLDPFALLELPRTSTPAEIKAAYRNKSRLIHPDKTDHPQARDAFEKLKKAESQLMDDEKRQSILALMSEARREVLALWQQEVQQGKRRPEDASEDVAEFEAAAMAKYRAIVVDIEWRKRQRLKQEMAAEGKASRKEEELAREQRRKKDEQRVWEDGRDDRVTSWRSFKAKGAGVSKKTKKDPMHERAKLAMAAAQARQRKQ
ncbi:DnaJ domain-containing protein [Coemansia sp. Benny D115]|nr:DnaJ domain-containing protein [Coemansia sp. Benny D115]